MSSLKKAILFGRCLLLQTPLDPSKIKNPNKIFIYYLLSIIYYIIIFKNLSVVQLRTWVWKNA